MTNIQKVDAYLANDRTKFLANREDYSYHSVITLEQWFGKLSNLRYDVC